MAITLLAIHTEPYALASGSVQMRTDALPEADAYGSQSELPEAGAYGSQSEMRYPRLTPNGNHFVGGSH